MTYVRSCVVYFARMVIEHLAFLLATSVPLIRTRPDALSIGSRRDVHVIRAEYQAEFLGVVGPMVVLPNEERRSFAIGKVSLKHVKKLRVTDHDLEAGYRRVKCQPSRQIFHLKYAP